jgi:hypothetical protein
MDDKYDGHSPETCNYTVCKGNQSTLCPFVKDATPEPSQPSSDRSTYLQLVDWQLLEDWCACIRSAFPNAFGTYLVGSCLRRPDFRDVDVRMIMPDEVFDAEFPNYMDYDPYSLRVGKLTRMNTAFSLYAQRATGLPIDFQFQRASEANAEYPTAEHKRNAIGIRRHN